MPATQRRLSEVLGGGKPATAVEAVPAAVSHTLADADLLVPRLVTRIAELEAQLYGTPSCDDSGGSADEGLMGRFMGLLKRAASGLDASFAFV